MLGDRLGRLRVTRDALAERDRLVLDARGDARVPVVTVMGGGYGVRIEETVEVYLGSVMATLGYRRGG